MSRKGLIAGLALLVLVPAIWLGYARLDPSSPGSARSSPAAGSSEGAAEPTPAASQLTLIEEVLTERARAVREGDRSAFLASVAPGSGAFRRQQRRISKRLASLPIGSYELELTSGEKDLAKPRHERRYEAFDDVFILRVEERYRFKGIDDAAFVNDVFITFVLHGDTWLIAADDDLGEKSTTDRSPWDFGALTTTRSEHFLLVQHPCRRPGCTEVGESFLQLAEAALVRVDERWPEPWNKRVVVFVTSTRRELRAILDVEFELGRFAAFSYAPSRTRGYSPARIVVNRAGLSERSPESLLVVLAHELTHVATRRPSGPDIPMWVEEGLAEWVSRTSGDGADVFFSDRARRGAGTPELPKDRDFRRSGKDQLFVHYQSSRSAVRYFIERYGYQRFIRFYRALGDSHDRPGSTDEHVNRAMRRFTGIGVRRFEAQWADTIGG
ncbi:MAG: hypothetical protein M3124_07730 [Actinomycetota bacterium]|nr:hypothetical protein [Actinomycetota bacterium]